MTETFLFLTCFLILFAAAFAYYDSRRLKNFKWIDQAGHFWRWMLRAYVVFTAVIVATGAAGEWWKYLFYLGILFWIFFDPLLAWMRGLPDPFFNKGSTALLDRIFPAVGYQLLTKFALLGASIFWLLK